VSKVYEKNYEINNNFNLQTVFNQLDENTALYQLLGPE